MAAVTRGETGITRDELRHALFDPHVRKRRILGYVGGYRINAGDLLRSLNEQVPTRAVTEDEADSAIRAAGGHRIGRGPLHLIGLQRESEYWLSIGAYRRATRRPADAAG